MAFSFKKNLKRKAGDNAPAAPVSPKVALNRKGAQRIGGKSGAGTPKKKSFRATSGAKYALIIGDDGAILIYVVRNVVQSRNFIAHASEENLKEFQNILAKDSSAPIFIIIDSMDQSFIQQSLPPISPLGVKKLIKRRLERDLGADVIKGYVLLERDASGRRDWNFLMVSLENSPNLNLWFDFIDRVDNRVSGIYLLSVEAENIIKSIDLATSIPRKSKKNPNVSRWKFFVSHNKVGGFRQVILKDERIIFTRLTQPISEANAEVVAGNIEQEMSSTIEYMKRLSFNAQQGLDIYVIASSDINKSMDLSKILAANIYKFTPFEVSEVLGITGAAQQTDQFGDVIMSAYIACSKVHRLVLSLPKTLKVNKLYDMVRYQRTLAGLVVLGVLSYGGMLGLGVMQKYSDMENLAQKKVIQQRKLKEIEENINKSGIDIKKVGDTVALYKQLESETESPLSILSKLREAIIAPVTIREVNWQKAAASDAAAGVPPPPPPPGSPGNEETISLILHFPEISGTDEAFKAVAKKVLRDVRAAFPEYQVVYTKLPDAISAKPEAGAIVFDDKKAPVEIDNNNLEATLTLTAKSENSPPTPPVINPGNPTTDELIGLRGKMKIADIRKVLIKQSIIVLVIVGVLVGGIFYLESLDEECDRNINSLKAEADGIIKQVADMSLEYNNVVSSMAAYNEIKQKQDKKMLMINTSALRDEINKVREKNHLSDLDVKMEGAKPLSGDKYKRSTAFIESNNINISFNALTDIDVLELINNLEHAFIGIKFTGLKLTLSKNVDNAMLIAIKDTGFSPIINAKLAFTLFGMRNVTVDDNELTSKEGAPAPVPDNDGRKLIRLRPR